MKFIREKLDSRYLERRIREEDAKSDRKVIEVVLSPPEWWEFITTMTHRWDCPVGCDHFTLALHDLNRDAAPRTVRISKGSNFAA